MTAMSTDVTSDAPAEIPTDPRVARSRARLLEAACELLVEGGPRAVTADAVAECSGVAKSTMYRHWATCNDLMLDAIRSNMPEVALPDPSMPFEAALRQIVADVAANLEAPEWRRILPALLSLQFQSPELSDALAADREDKEALMADVLDRGVAEGRIPAGLDPLMMLDLLAGPLVLAALSRRGETLAALADLVVDRVLAPYA